MPITLNKDSINFGNYSISLHPNGIEIDGKFKYASSDIYVRPFQGTISGYTSGGTIPPNNSTNTIDKFPFSSNANATDVGDLTQARRESAGQSMDLSSIVPLISSFIITSCSGPDNNLRGENA